MLIVGRSGLIGRFHTELVFNYKLAHVSGLHQFTYSTYRLVSDGWGLDSCPIQNIRAFSSSPRVLDSLGIFLHCASGASDSGILCRILTEGCVHVVHFRK